VLALGLLFVGGIVAAALDLQFGFGGTPRRVEPNSLLVLDPASGATVQDRKLGYEPKDVRLIGSLAAASSAEAPSGGTACQGALLLRAAGYDWFACHGPDRLVRVRLPRGMRTTVAGISAAPAAAAYGSGRVWAVEKDGNELVAINPFTAKVVGTTVVGTDPVAITVGFGAVWVANAGNGSVTRVDLSNGKAEAIGLDYQPDRIAAGAGAVWVVSRNGKTVIRIDPKQREVTKTIRLANPPVDVAAGAGRVWVAIGH
jgi:DNA-binding beta-propeller fold protein YncE